LRVKTPINIVEEKLFCACIKVHFRYFNSKSKISIVLEIIIRH